MSIVAITGVGGLMGRRLVAALDRDPAVETILGFDLHEPEGLYSTKLEFAVQDIQQPGLRKKLAGVDTLVHLAFQMNPMRDEVAMHAINVLGTQSVFEAAADAGVRKLVYVSSGVAYGAHADNDFPLTEDSPLRANQDFNYAAHKLEVERWLWPWAKQHPKQTVTVLRPSIVAGPGVENFITRQLELPRFTAVRGFRPPWQFAHIEDVVSALELVVGTDLPGAFNVSSAGWLSFDEVVAILGRGTLDIPPEVAFATADRMWRAGLAQAPAGQLHYVMHPWVLDIAKLRAAGWAPKHSNRDALAELVADHAHVISLPGNVRVERNTVRAGAAAVGVLGAALAVRAVRRSRRG